jgi:hypothetical protein
MGLINYGPELRPISGILTNREKLKPLTRWSCCIISTDGRRHKWAQPSLASLRRFNTSRLQNRTYRSNFRGESIATRGG